MRSLLDTQQARTRNQPHATPEGALDTTREQALTETGVPQPAVTRAAHNKTTVDWDGHVTAVLAEWVLRWIMPPDRDECAWKHVLHHMVLVDRQGYDKFPEGRNIMLCRMTPADKLRLMRGVPKNAVYIKECVRAFWKINLRQDLTDTRHMRAGILLA